MPTGTLEKRGIPKNGMDERGIGTLSSKCTLKSFLVLSSNQSPKETYGVVGIPVEVFSVVQSDFLKECVVLSVLGSFLVNFSHPKPVLSLHNSASSLSLSQIQTQEQGKLAL